MVRRPPKVSVSRSIYTNENGQSQNGTPLENNLDKEWLLNTPHQGLVHKNHDPKFAKLHQTEETICLQTYQQATRDKVPTLKKTNIELESKEELVKKSDLEKELVAKFELWKQDFLKEQQDKTTKETGTNSKALRPPPPPPAMPSIDWTAQTICLNSGFSQQMLIENRQKALKSVAWEADEGYEGYQSDESLSIDGKLKIKSRKKESNPIFADGKFQEKLDILRQKAESCYNSQEDFEEKIKAKKILEAQMQNESFQNQIKLKKVSHQKENISEEFENANVFPQLKRSLSIRRESYRPIPKLEETELQKILKKRSLTINEPNKCLPITSEVTTNNNEGENNSFSAPTPQNIVEKEADLVISFQPPILRNQQVSSETVCKPISGMNVDMIIEEYVKNHEPLQACFETSIFKANKVSTIRDFNPRSALLEQIRKGKELKKASNVKMVPRQSSSIEKQLIDKVCEVRRKSIEESDEEEDADNDEWEE